MHLQFQMQAGSNSCRVVVVCATANSNLSPHTGGGEREPPRLPASHACTPSEACHRIDDDLETLGHSRLVACSISKQPYFSLRQVGLPGKEEQQVEVRNACPVRRRAARLQVGLQLGQTCKAAVAAREDRQGWSSQAAYGAPVWPAGEASRHPCMRFYPPPARHIRQRHP